MKNISKCNSSTSNSLPVSGSSAKLKSRSWLAMYCFVLEKSHDQMVRVSIKPGDQTEETESPNLVNKTGLAKI